MKQRFLIVEDAQFDAEFIAEWLHRQFGESSLHLTANVMDAISQFRPGWYQAAFINLKLSGDPVAGIGLLKRFRKQEPDLPIFVVTGADSEDMRRLAIAAGATGFFSKDFDGTEAQCVRNTIRLRNEAVQRGRNMRRSWRTTLSGACTATGMAMFGGPMAISATKFEVPTAMMNVCIWGGLILTVLGIFFGHLFAADKRELEDRVNHNKPPTKDEP